MTPRRARPEEAAALRDLVRTSYAAWVPVIGREPAPMNDDYAARIVAGQAWVVAAEGRLLGAIVLEVTPTGLLVDNVAVAPECQGTGLGRALMAFAEAEAQRRGLRRIWLYTHEKMTRNIALYERLGFVETHRAEQNGFARVFMAKAVAPAPRPERRPAQDQPRPPLLHRLALAEIGPDRRRPHLAEPIFFLVVGLVLLIPAAMVMQVGWRDRQISADWYHTTARVLEIGRIMHVKGGRQMDVRLLAHGPDGAAIEAWALRPHVLVWRLEVPHPRIGVGDMVQVAMNPSDPHRMVTIAALNLHWPFIMAAVFGTAALVAFLTALIFFKRWRLLSPRTE